jgi:NitT/TauT family transport system substrate-binding protein
MRFLPVLLAAAALIAGPAQAQKVWRHGVVEAKSDSGIAFMPAQHDFAAREGLKIEYVQFKGDALVIKAFLAGDLDSYESNPGGAIIAASHGADVKVTGCYWPGLTYGIFTKGEVGSVKDLAGKTFAISGPGSLPDLMARAALEQNGVPASTVRFAVLGSDADRYRALLQGVVNAAAFSTEFLPLAQANNMTMVFNAAEQLPNYLRFCVYMSSATLRDRPDEAASFLAAEMQGWRYALDHKDEAVALARKLSGAKPDDPRPEEVFTQVTKYHAVDPTMPVPMEKLAWMQDLLVHTGNLKAPYDLSRLVDTTIREKALAKLGNSGG